MKPKTTPDEPGVPVETASFIGRGLWLGLIALLVTAFLAWLIIEWLNS